MTPATATTPTASGASLEPVLELTVAISLFNYGHYIAAAMESVCQQTMAQAIELIVVDDASKDQSVAMVEQFCRDRAALIGRLGAFRLVRHDHNRGLAEARNTAFALANTPSVLVLDADNRLLPQACSTLLAALRSAPPTIGAAYPLLVVEGHPRQRVANELPWNDQRLRQGNTVDALALVRREAWQQVGGFVHTPGGWEDFDFWCKLIETGHHGVLCPEVLATYQRHGKSMLQSQTNHQQRQLSRLLQHRHPWLQLALGHTEA